MEFEEYDSVVSESEWALTVLPETFCQKKRSYSKITEKRTFYPKITEKRTFWPKKTEKERNSGAQKNGVRSFERVLATLARP